MDILMSTLTKEAYIHSVPGPVNSFILQSTLNLKTTLKEKYRKEFGARPVIPWYCAMNVDVLKIWVKKKIECSSKSIIGTSEI